MKKFKAKIYLKNKKELNEYLKKYENIFDQRVYHTEIQSYAKQMFFASQAMKQEASEDTTGQNFVYDM